MFQLLLQQLFKYHALPLDPFTSSNIKSQLGGGVGGWFSSPALQILASKTYIEGFVTFYSYLCINFQNFAFYNTHFSFSGVDAKVDVVILSS